MRLGIVGILAALLGAAGCYEAPKPACQFLCGAGDACPTGYGCGDDNRCHRIEGDGSLAACTEPLPTEDDAATIDASTIDATPIDASDIDATPIDAEVPDAEVPDAEVPDAEVPDAEVPDAEVPDAEVPDAAPPDAEAPDAAI